MPTLTPEDWQDGIDWLGLAQYAIPVAVAVLVALVWVLESLFAEGESREQIRL